MVYKSYMKALLYSLKALQKLYEAWKVSKYEVISGPYFPVFGLKYRKDLR